jgi:hypothetical protein
VERERECPNKDRGCSEWVPHKELAKHLKEVCVVTLHRNELAEHGRTQRELFRCRNGCGTKLPRASIKLHENDLCLVG